VLVSESYLASVTAPSCARTEKKSNTRTPDFEPLHIIALYYYQFDFISDIGYIYRHHLLQLFYDQVRLKMLLGNEAQEMMVVFRSNQIP